MSFLSIFVLMGLCLASCSSRDKNKGLEAVDKKTVGILPTEDQPNLISIAEFPGLQVTGVTVTEEGRLFASFPRWRDNVPFSVIEILADGTHMPYPNESWNSWSGEPKKNKFTSAQAILAHDDFLYVLDSSAPEIKKITGKARLYEFDLKTNELKRSWEFDEDVALERSHLSDLQVDDKTDNIFITDSGVGGIVILDMKTGHSRRALDKHPSTKSEDVVLTVNRRPYLLPDGKRPKVHSAGLALSPIDNKLYYHALTGYHLYRVPTKTLDTTLKDETQLVKKVEKLGVTPAPDGMAFDKKGNLYMGDLERNAISYRTPSGDMRILIQDERIKWPNSLTIDSKNNLIFTDSILQNEQIGKNVDNMIFKIYKVSIPN